MLDSFRPKGITLLGFLYRLWEVMVVMVDNAVVMGGVQRVATEVVLVLVVMSP
jgi:hypothetical protein